jgi:hypothetical protein
MRCISCEIHAHKMHAYEMYGASLSLSIRKITLFGKWRQQVSSLDNRPTDRLTKDRR